MNCPRLLCLSLMFFQNPSPHTHTNEELQVGPDSSDYQRVECAETSTFYPIQPGEKGTEEIERPDNPGPWIREFNLTHNIKSVAQVD